MGPGLVSELPPVFVYAGSSEQWSGTAGLILVRTHRDLTYPPHRAGPATLAVSLHPSDSLVREALFVLGEWDAMLGPAVDITTAEWLL